MSVAITNFMIGFSAKPDDELFFIGDIHGRSDLLKSLIELIKTSPRMAGKKRVLVFLGDLIDRGPDSLGCLDLAIEAQDSGDFDDVWGLMGNHEQFLAVALANPDNEKGELAAHNWIFNGGKQVLEEMRSAAAGEDLDVAEALGERRLTWLRGLRSHFISGRILTVHAGVNPERDIQSFLEEDWNVSFRGFNEAEHWAWIRGPFLDHQPEEGRGHQGFFVIHGHTPQPHDPAQVDEQIRRCRLNIDGGSYSTGKARMARVIGNQITLFETA